MLMNDRRWQVVGEAADAPDAIQSVQALRPDVILLDVELGVLNGIEAARRILAVDPDSKILFVSAHRSWDIAGAALSTGARGYLLKSDAGHELFPALETVVRGGRFISARLLGRPLDPLQRTSPGHDRPRSHEAALYPDDTFLLDGLAQFAGTALDVGKSVLVVITEARRAGIDERLRAQGIDIDLAINEGRYIPMDVAEMFSAVMIDGWPDEGRVWTAAMSLMMQAASVSPDDHPRLAVCGEGAAFLVEQGKVDAAIQLEHLWDEVARVCYVDIFCPYLMTALPAPEDADVWQRIGAVHSTVYGA
jgi:CheY-like chemotaxis protein